MTLRLIVLSLFLAFGVSTQAARAQQILIDRGVQAGGLWCFPLATDQRQYVYLPNTSRLAHWDAGRPKFSFVRYIVNLQNEAASDSSITTADGGGILNFVVIYETPQSAVDEAQRILRRDRNDKEITLRGPIVFQQGRYTLVSSVINQSSGKEEARALAAGNAPVVEGNEIALSFDLRPKEASLLMQSFASQTPDVSIVFDLTFQGLTDAYDAELVIDWAEVVKSEGFSAGGSVYFIGADVELMLKELFRKNAIKLRSAGSDISMEALLTNVYNKLLELMFRPVEPERAPPESSANLMTALSGLTGQGRQLSSRRVTGFGLNVGYQLKEIKNQGVSVLNFNHRAAVNRHCYLTFNIGNLYRRHGKDPELFRSVNLGDPAFQQREVTVMVDGALLSDFASMINNVSVTMRKVHQSGKVTPKEVLITEKQLSHQTNHGKLIYGWDGDDDRMGWLHYEYRTIWSFKGGGKYETKWTPADAPMINLYAPYRRQTVLITGDQEAPQMKSVRAVDVLLKYDFFGTQRSELVRIVLNKPIEERKVELTLPLNQFDCDYTITWKYKDGRSLEKKGRNSNGLIFIDEIQ